MRAHFNMCPHFWYKRPDLSIRISADTQQVAQDTGTHFNISSVFVYIYDIQYRDKHFLCVGR